MDTNTTRRNLLRFGTTAAAYAAGASIVTGGIALASQAKGAEVPAVNREAWDRAYRAMTIASIADDAINARYEASDTPGRDALEDEYERLGEVHYAATWALFAIPAPDHAALLWKTEYLFGDRSSEDGASPSWAAHVMAVYLADTRRLLAQEGR